MRGKVSTARNQASVPCPASDNRCRVLLEGAYTSPFTTVRRRARRTQNRLMFLEFLQTILYP